MSAEINKNNMKEAVLELQRLRAESEQRVSGVITKELESLFSTTGLPFGATLYVQVIRNSHGEAVAHTVEFNWLPAL